jgi:hypothetical protein
MNFLSCDVMTILSFISNEPRKLSAISKQGVVEQPTSIERYDRDNASSTWCCETDETNQAEEIEQRNSSTTSISVTSIVLPSPLVTVTPNHEEMDDTSLEFQIRSTLYSWSFCWNRGDISGYCHSYRNDARYVSINYQGRMTTIHGRDDITTFFTKLYQQCERRYQAKCGNERMTIADATSKNCNIAGYLEFKNVNIELIPAASTNANALTSITDRTTHQAVVFGHYTLDLPVQDHAMNQHDASSKIREHGVFTLHLVQDLSSIWKIQSEHSSSININRSI